MTQEQYFATLPISNWLNEIIIGSIIFFILETKFKFSKNFKIFLFTLPFIIKEISALIFNSKFTLVFIKIIKDINFIEYNFILKSCALVLAFF